MKRGRPTGSSIRQNIIELLYIIGSAHGYQLSKIYPKIFPATTQRNIYYHLKKGQELKEIEIDRVEHEQGDYSWGTTASKTYYKIGKKATPRAHPHIRTAVNKIYPNPLKDTTPK